MARRTREYEVADEGRDLGKLFLITEMPASKAEAWAYRAILAMINGGVDIPDDAQKAGIAGIAQVGLKALLGLRWDILEPLLAEMWECVQIIPDAKNRRPRKLIEEDIEEPLTRSKIRLEVFDLHTGFLQAVAALKSAKEDSTAASTENLPST